MVGGQLDTIRRHVRRLGGADEETDRQLLERFAARRDEQAFALLVRRHGPMVMGLCRRALRHPQDVEDAFQATFLVLARKAAAVRWGESVGGWLCAVAQRVAAKARCAAARRLAGEKEAAMKSGAPAGAEVVGDELHGAVYEEVGRLPEKYRLPVVVCCLEGRSHAEAAHLLGWPLGTVKGRLARARSLLQSRLARRGLAPGAIALAGGSATASVPPSLAEATARAARLFVTTPSAVSASAASLARVVLRAMPAGRAAWGAVLALMTGLLAGGVALSARISRYADDAPGSPRAAPQAGEAPTRIEVADGPLPPQAVMRLGAVRPFRPGSRVEGAAFSPDSRVLALACQRGLGLWDAATGKELRRLKEGWGADGVAFSVDGKTLVSHSHTGELVQFWTSTGKELRTFRIGVWVRCAALSPDGKALVVGCEDGTVRFWDVAAGKERLKRKGHKDPVASVAFSPDGATLASGSFDSTVRLWDVASGRELRRMDTPALPGARGWVARVLFSPDGRAVVCSHGDGIIRVWDAGSGKELRQLRGHGEMVVDLAFAPGGKVLFSGSHDRTIRVWDFAAGRELRRFTGWGQQSGVLSLALSPDGKSLASWGGIHTVRLWDADTGRERLHGKGHQDEVVKVRFTPGGKGLVSWGRDRTVRSWDLATGAERAADAGSNWVHYDDGVALSPDGKLLAVGSQEALQLWETATGKRMHRLAGNEEWVYALAFTPDGKTLATSGTGKTVRLWDVAGGKERRRWAVPEEVRVLTFSPDGTVLASGGGTNAVRLWDANTGKELRRLDGHAEGPPLLHHTDRPTLAVFTPDGRHLLTGRRDDPLLRLWEVAGARLVRTFRLPDPQQGNVGLFAAAFSPGGRVLACSTLEGDVLMWETATGREVGRFRGHADCVRWLEFAPDGRLLASASSDATVLLWDVTGRLKDGRLPAADLPPGRGEALWAELSGADAAKARRAVWELVAAGERALPLLGKHLRPAAAADPRRVARLLADLDGGRFSVREKATRELEELGSAAEPALRRALDERPSVETRRRVVEILAKLDPGAPAQVGLLRGVEVLELMDTAGARRLLEELARGDARAWLTRESGHAHQALRIASTGLRRTPRTTG